MNLTSSAILAIVPRSRHIGVSVIRDDDLIFYAVKTIQSETRHKTQAKLRKILKNIIDEYEITHIALQRIVFIQQHRSEVKIVFDVIKSFLKQESLPCYEYSPTTIRKTICNDGRPIKSKTAFILAQKYPELTRYLKVKKIWQKRYFSPLLDAVAVGYVSAEERQKEQKSKNLMHDTKTRCY